MIELKKCHEFESEYQEHIQFIDSQISSLFNEEFGKDYEHCVLLQSKFRKQKKIILDHEERIRSCMEYGESLIKNLNEQNKKFEISQIRERIGNLKNKYSELVS